MFSIVKLALVLVLYVSLSSSKNVTICIDGGCFHDVCPANTSDASGNCVTKFLPFVLTSIVQSFSFQIASFLSIGIAAFVVLFFYVVLGAIILELQTTLAFDLFLILPFLLSAILALGMYYGRKPIRKIDVRSNNKIRKTRTKRLLFCVLPDDVFSLKPIDGFLLLILLLVSAVYALQLYLAHEEPLTRVYWILTIILIVVIYTTAAIGFYIQIGRKIGYLIGVIGILSVVTEIVYAIASLVSVLPNDFLLIGLAIGIFVVNVILAIFFLRVFNMGDSMEMLASMRERTGMIDDLSNDMSDDSDEGERDPMMNPGLSSHKSEKGAMKI